MQTATGAVLFYALILPVFPRCLRFFPPLVIGTMLLLVGVNLIAVYGGVIAGRPGTPAFGDPAGLGLAMATVLLTVLFVRVLPGMPGQLAVMFGLVAGTLVAAASGMMHWDPVFAGPLLGLPTAFPFGWPKFDLPASLPMLLFSAVSMAEATSQTVVVSEVVGRPVDRRQNVPRTILGDAPMSLIGGCFGASLIITSSENIGIVRATGVRSRYATAACGAMLVLLALVAPLARLANAIPAPVVGGTAAVVFAIICGNGHRHPAPGRPARAGQFVHRGGRARRGAAADPGAGDNGRFPATLQIILGNGLAMGTMAAVLSNIVFHHLGRSAVAAEPGDAQAVRAP